MGIPNVHRDLRIHLMDEVNNLIRNLVSAESAKGNKGKISNESDSR